MQIGNSSNLSFGDMLLGVVVLCHGLTVSLFIVVVSWLSSKILFTYNPVIASLVPEYMVATVEVSLIILTHPQ